jgi:periplasmic mercuric ion binding protein
MKKTILVSIVFALVSLTSMAQSESNKKKETFKVFGNCGMCESKIEGAVKDKKGVYSADWNQKSKKMTISYDSKKISLNQLKQLIADAGYDTQSHRAKDKTYNGLHGCCKYDRPE